MQLFQMFKTNSAINVSHREEKKRKQAEQHNCAC